jgi:septal ring factor EnvC (AmiA/AmiB activator)
MALISCPECGQKVSDQAPSCPHCGYSLRAGAQGGQARQLGSRAKDWSQELRALHDFKRELEQEVNDANHQIARLRLEMQPHTDRILELQTEIATERRTVGDLRSAGAQQDAMVTKESSAIYACSTYVLDAGSLELFWNRLRYSGWRGQTSILLSDIASIEAGSSKLPSRIGIPFVGGRWPGEAKDGETLLLTVRSEGNGHERVVLAGLPIGSDWPNAVRKAVEEMGAIRGARQAADEQQTAAQQRMWQLETVVQQEQGIANDLRKQIRDYEKTRDRATRELALPDWEQRTISITGAFLDEAVQRRLQREVTDGWEVVSTQQGKDKVTAMLRQVRRF